MSDLMKILLVSPGAEGSRFILILPTPSVQTQVATRNKEGLPERRALRQQGAEDNLADTLLEQKERQYVSIALAVTLVF